jgi:hypothetical protein
MIENLSGWQPRNHQPDPDYDKQAPKPSGPPPHARARPDTITGMNSATQPTAAEAHTGHTPMMHG